VGLSGTHVAVEDEVPLLVDEGATLQLLWRKSRGELDLVEPKVVEALEAVEVRAFSQAFSLGGLAVTDLEFQELQQVFLEGLSLYGLAIFCQVLA